MNDRSRRVLMLSDVYFPRVNGVSTSIQTFRNDLAALGCESVLLAPAYPQARDDEAGVVRVPSRRVPFDPEDRLMRPRALRKRLEHSGDFDVVHVQTPFAAHRAGIALGRALAVPVVESYHTYFEHYFHHYLPFLPAGVLRFAARAVSRAQCDAVDVVVAPTEPMAQALRAYGVRAPIRVIPTGIDLARFRGGDGARFRARYGIEPDRPLMLTVGRVAFEKNIDLLLDVLARVRVSVPNALFVIAGEGPALASLERRVRREGQERHVLFVGYLDRADGLLDCYGAADAFVFASRTETQGLVLLEAMALGVAVGSTAVMGTAAVLHGAEGAIVVAEDRSAFAAAVVRVLTNAQLRAALEMRAAAHVADRWSSEAAARRMLGLYKEVTQRRLRAAAAAGYAR